MKAIAIALTTFVLMGVLPTLSHADQEHDSAYYTKQLEGWSSIITELQQLDTTKASVQEVERIRNLVGQAQAFLAAEKLRAIDPLLERTAALNALVRARSHRIDAETKAARAEEAAARAEAEALAAHNAAATAEKRLQELEAKGL